MWFSHVLLGLVSLAGLTAAAPTSAGASIQVVDDAPTLLKARYPLDSRAAKALAVHARAIEDRPVQTLDAQGLPPLNVGDVMFCNETQCVILHSLDNQCMGVLDDFRGHIKQITQGIGSHCYYYTSSTCDPRTLIHQTTTKPDPYIALAGVIKDVASVTCEPTAGYISACKAAGRGMSFSALDKWFELKKDYSHQLIDITQRAGVYCRYYTGFAGNWLFDKFIPTKEGDQRIVNDQVEDVGLMWCSLETTRVIFCKTMPSPTGSCARTTELGKCKQLDSGFAHQVNNITQIAGSYCKFYDNCGGRMVFDSHSCNGDAHYMGDSVLSQVGGFYCELEAKAAELQTTTHTLEAGSTPLVKKVIIEAREGTPFEAVPGYVYGCNQRGDCMGLPAINVCQQFTSSFWHNLSNIWQRKGAICRYFRDSCSETPIILFDSRNGDVDYNIGNIGIDIGYVKCGTKLWTAAEREADDISIPIVTYESAKLLARDDEQGFATRAFEEPGDTIVCHLKNHRFCHENRINALKQCANFDPNDGGPSSLKQYRGVYCKWFDQFGCRNEKHVLPLIVNSLNVTVEVGDLGTKYNNRLKSVKCETHEW